MAPNVYVAADSNHGYKMIAVGKEIAEVLRRRPLVAALPVPLRALRDRRPAPGVALALPLELMRRAAHRGLRRVPRSTATTWGWPTRGRSRRRARCPSSCPTWSDVGRVLDVGRRRRARLRLGHRPRPLRRRAASRR